MKHISTKRLLAIASVIALVLGIGFARDHAATPSAHAAPPLLGKQSAGSFADVVDKALPGVVNVYTTKVNPRGPSRADPFFNDPRSPFRGQPGRRYANSLGSGVIVSADGYVLTNNHVVSGADEISVALSDSRNFTAKIVGSDPNTDLAVLKLEGKVGRLQPVKIGSSSNMRLGDVVLAIGNPFGVGQAVTMGIVSAKGRTGMGIVDYEDFIQTDAAINPGNSGGALINMNGELIGINTAILSRTGGYQGIGFAIPTDMAVPIMNELISDGKVSRGWLGVEIRTLDRQLAEAEKLPEVQGVLIAAVMPRGPAARAGLREGDVVLRMDGAVTKSSDVLRNAVANAGPNRTVEFEVLRSGKNRRIKVRLGDRSKASQSRR